MSQPYNSIDVNDWAERQADQGAFTFLGHRNLKTGAMLYHVYFNGVQVSTFDPEIENKFEAYTPLVITEAEKEDIETGGYFNYPALAAEIEEQFEDALENSIMPAEIYYDEQ